MVHTRQCFAKSKSIHFSPGRQQDNEADSIVWLKAIRVKNRQLMIERCVAFNQAHPDRGSGRGGERRDLEHQRDQLLCCSLLRGAGANKLSIQRISWRHNIGVRCNFAHVRKRIYFALKHEQVYCGLAC